MPEHDSDSDLKPAEPVVPGDLPGAEEFLLDEEPFDADAAEEPVDFDARLQRLEAAARALAAAEERRELAASMPTRATLVTVTVALTLSAAGCLYGLAFGDPEDSIAETSFAALLGISLLGLAAAAWTAGLRARAIREITKVMLATIRAAPSSGRNTPG